jgi:hypothetical protein
VEIPRAAVYPRSFRIEVGWKAERTPSPNGPSVFAGSVVDYFSAGILHVSRRIVSGSLDLVYLAFGLESLTADCMTHGLFGFADSIVNGALYVFLVHIPPLRTLDAALKGHDGNPLSGQFNNRWTPNVS